MEKQTQSKARKTIGIVANVILWLFVIFSVGVTVIAVSASANKKGVPCVGGNCYLTVLSDSMNAPKPEWVGEDAPAGFSKGDMLISRYIVDDEAAIAALRVGDIITFEWDITNDGVISEGEYNTHRIVRIVETDGKIDYFETQGDNAEYSRGQTEKVKPAAVIARYDGNKLSGVGHVMNFLQSSLGFGLCILLPLALFFVYELVVFIRTVLSLKNEGKKVISAEDEELIKQRAIEECLKRQNEGKNDSSENPPESKG
ncbi:MAG TPA: hypothetical protein DDY70_06845 [Clostridiales bacterium]|nr:hypothetical protein [Clostridiales bacterium]